MGIYTIAELKKYFRKSGNKYVYIGGLTQTQLIGAMDKKVEPEIDDTVLSKVIQGKRNLTKTQADAFALASNLSETQRYELEYAIARDRCLSKGFEIHLGASPPSFNIILRNLERVGQLRQQNAIEMLHLAVDVLSDIYEWKRQLEPSTVAAPVVLRVFSMIELERAQLLHALERYRGSLEFDSIITTNIDLEVENVAALAEIEWSLPVDLHDNLGSYLSDTERTIWEQRYVAQMPIEKIAKQYGVSTTTIHSILMATREKVLDELVQH